ncbi:hypothetical protein CFK39_12495 [Brachybacterium avium]|uniref:Uncharacterized protein n=1 Tax=Brachybacterium avium TaxID=2017485 RepID=A0A220UHN0_9MICO|nr:hypothetical protein CFK39_12495 [Brachybacterium avium]
MNDSENPNHPEHPTDPVGPEDGAGIESGADTAHSAGRGSAEPVDAFSETEVTSVYVRRRRTPTLGFWVALAILVPAVAALLSAPFFDFADLSGVVNFMLVAAVFIGLPLAAIAALVDAIRHRDESRRRR